VYFTNCIHIYLLAALSFERYYILKSPQSIKQIEEKFIIKIIILIVSLSLFWSSAPLIGWSFYAVEDGFTSCTVEWKEKSLNVISLNFLMFIFVFCIPFTMITICNFKSFLIVIFL
jgi:hypothetical protein